MCIKWWQECQRRTKGYIAGDPAAAGAAGAGVSVWKIRYTTRELTRREGGAAEAPPSCSP